MTDAEAMENAVRAMRQFGETLCGLSLSLRLIVPEARRVLVAMGYEPCALCGEMTSNCLHDLQSADGVLWKFCDEACKRAYVDALCEERESDRRAWVRWTMGDQR